MTLNRSSGPGAIFILTSIIILLSTGCSDKKQIKGKEFIPRDDMMEMMVDIHLLDGITNDVKFYRKYNPNDSIDLYGQIFEKYGYKRAQFDTTLVEYARNPHLLNALYNDVMGELNLLQDQLTKEEEEKREKKANADLKVKQVEKSRPAK